MTFATFSYHFPPKSRLPSTSIEVDVETYGAAAILALNGIEYLRTCIQRAPAHPSHLLFLLRLSEI